MKRPSPFDVGLIVFVLATSAHAQDSEFLFDNTGNLTAQIADSAAAPQILGQPQMQIIIPGNSASFSVRVADTGGVSYQWLYNGTSINGANSDALLITNVAANNAGTYAVVIANDSGSVTSAPASLLIDSRGCGMPDAWQLAYFGNLNQNATGDFDGDGVSNLQEFLDGTNPTNAASVLYRITLLNDGGTVVAVPDQSAYTEGQVVTLTASGSTAFPFHAWTGDVTTRSNSITVTMTNNLTLFAHFLPFTFTWTNTVAGNWNVPSNWTPNLAPSTNESVVIAKSVIVTLNSDVNLLDFMLGGANLAPELTGTGRLRISGTGAWLGGTMSGTGATIIAPGASFTIASPVTAVNLNNRTLENRGMALWSGGGLIGINNGIITNDAGAVFQVLSPSSFNYEGGSPRFDNAGTFLTPTSGTTTFSSVAFNNYGTANILGGTLSMLGGGIHAGTMTVPAGTTVIFGGGVFSSSAGSSMTGAGALTINGGASTLAGTVNLSGTHTFSNGSVDFTGNYTCTNSTMVISGGNVSFDGTGTVAPAVLNLSNGNLGGANTVTAVSAMSWTGGNMIGSGRTFIPAGVTLTIANPLSITVTSRTLDNGGTAIWSGAGIMALNAAIITNRPGALFNVQNANSFIFGGGSPRLDNAGTFLTPSSGGTTTFNSVAFNNFATAQIQGGTLALGGGGINNGSITVPAGTTINFSGGPFSAGGTSTILGAGNLTVSSGTANLGGLVNLNGTNLFSGTANLTGNYICTNNTMVISGGGNVGFDGTGTVAPAVLNLSNGNLGGANTVTVGSAMSWTGGNMIGSGRTVIPAGVTLTIANPLSITMTSRTLDNGGTTIWSGAGIMALNAAIITNRPGALFNVQNANSFIFGGGSPRLDNAGTFLTPSSGGTTTFNSVAFNNFATAQIQGGTLALGGGGINNGSITVPAGTMINFSGGPFSAGGTSTISGAGNLTVSSGTANLGGLVNLNGTNLFSGTANLTGNYICTNNTMVISGGGNVGFDGTGTVAPAVLNLSNGNLGGANTVTVGSAMSWTGGNMIGSGRTVIPAGVTLTIANPLSITMTSRTLDNGGTTIWSGAGIMALNGAIITNRPGALFNVQNSASVNFGGGSPRLDNAGTFRKSVSTGTTTFSSVAFNNYGTVDMQNGFLAANGGYVSSSNAVLNCALAGTVPGANYGQLQISGAVTLKGTLSVNLANNYIPATNTTFTVLTAGTRTGIFSGFSYPTNQVTMQLSNTANSVIVRVTGVAPSPPVLFKPLLSGTNVLLTWTAVSNITYRLEFNPALTPSNWNPLPGDVLGVSNTASKLDALTSSNRFYRVQVLP